MKNLIIIGHPDKNSFCYNGIFKTVLSELQNKSEEIEIIDLLNIYKKKKLLKADFIGRGGSWLDTGNINDFNDASNFIYTIENRQGLKIACLEEISLKNKWIGKKEIQRSIKFYGNCDYSRYLKKL